MKKIILLSFICLFSVLLNATELDWVNEQIEAIKPPRKGLASSDVSDLASPFIFLKAATAKPEASKPIASTSPKASSDTGLIKPKITPSIPKKTLFVDAIMNKSALISGTWYKINDIVYGYTILDVTSDSVVLTQQNKKLVLSTKSANRNLKFKNK